MRFKARLATEHIQILYNTITPLTRLTSSSTASHDISNINTSITSTSHRTISNSICHLIGGGTIIQLEPTVLRISTKGRGCDGSDGVSCFVELSTDNKSGIFLEHCIESVANNVIVFEIDILQLKLALQSILEGGKIKNKGLASSFVPCEPLCQSQNTMSTDAMSQMGSQQQQYRKSKNPSTMYTPSIIVMKLAKRNDIPCLCLDAAMCGSVEVHHAIPIRMMRTSEMDSHLPPSIGLPDVQLELTPERPLRNVVERLKSMSPFVYLEGNMKGELTIRVDTDGISLRTFYNNLTPQFQQEDNNNNNTLHEKSCTLKVDSKKLFTCLQWQTTMPLGRGLVNSAIICMIENEMLVLHVVLGCLNGFFTYYIPVHFLSPDQID